jgi:hypothetical protein
MPMLTIKSVHDAFEPFLKGRAQLLEECHESPEIIRGYIWQLEDIRQMAQKVGMTSDYIAIIEDLSTELSVLQCKQQQLRDNYAAV